jgi:hypothetical protein
MALVLDGLPHARMRDVIITALDAEGFTAAFHLAVGANGSSAVGARRNGFFTAWQAFV